MKVWMRVLAVLADIAGILCTALAVAIWRWMSYLFPLEKAGLIALAIFGALLILVTPRLWRFRRRATLITWSVVQVLSLAFLVGVVYPTLTSMSGRSTQKRTMSELRTIGTAVEAYATDFNRYPVASSLDDLERHLAPTYVRSIPRRDAWRSEYRYFTWQEHYAVWSGGKDRRFDYADPRRYKGGPTTNFDCDIVYSNGAFIQWPEGPQSR